MSKLLQMRRAQRNFFRMVDQHRLLAFLARRQFGKTTTFAKIALKKMMKTPNHTVVFGSAKLNLSREIVRMEAAILQAAIAEAIKEGSGGGDMLQVFDGAAGRRPDVLSPDDFAELFEAQRLEFRFYHDRTCYSRTKVVALRPDAVGETGDLMCDEIGRIANWRDVWEAVSPIVASNPKFRICFSTTPPPDDAHYSFEMLAPPVGMDFKPNPDGNIYVSEMGVTVLRVDAWDAFADGVPVYDMSTGDPLTPDESRRRESDKDAWDRNYGCKFVIGGTSACNLLSLDTAQRRGIDHAAFVAVYCDEDFDRSIDLLIRLLGPGKVGIGVDVATTTGGVSNPTSVTVLEEDGVNYIARLIVIWKTADPEVARERIARICNAVAQRSNGGRAKRVNVDATNERYFAVDLKRHLLPITPVQLVSGSETIERPGYGKQTSKQVLGGQLIAVLDDNCLSLPPDKYVREDWRMIKKERGLLTCDPDHEGRHGDTFDSTKLALSAVQQQKGRAEVSFNTSISVQAGKPRDPRNKDSWERDAGKIRHLMG